MVRFIVPKWDGGQNLRSKTFSSQPLSIGRKDEPMGYGTDCENTVGQPRDRSCVLGSKTMDK